MNIFIFHRDFRIIDNRGLSALAKEEKEIFLIFIFTVDQIKNNEYFSEKSFQAMVFCLKELNKKVHINFLEAKDELTAVKSLIKAGNKINKIFTNKDYTPYAIKRSNDLWELSKKENFVFREFNDYLLFNPQEIKKEDGSFYQVFTPYWNAIRFEHNIPDILSNVRFTPMKLNNTIDINKYESNNFNLPLTRDKVKNSILSLSKDYQTRRNIIFLDNATSKISTAIKYGVISCREVHYWAKERFGHFDNGFSRQALWRDFFYQATYNAIIEKKWTFGTNWSEKMNGIKWAEQTKADLYFEKWSKGETGVPLVDAGMQELNNFGTMHNRVRLVCGSYLVKNLNVNWKVGEKYFAKKLIDYDPIVNQCSWQWVAGTGFDAQQYIRIFSPFIQQQKFDPDCIYINKYLKRKKEIPQIVDYKQSVEEAKKRYKLLIK